MVKGIKDFEFQNDCVNFLIQKTVERDSKKVVTVKAPTGAGKTIILIKYIDEYLNNTDNNTAFVWLCPGKGDLEEQSKEQMERITPQRDTRNLLYSLLTGFTPGSITFVNWELVTKRGNNALKDGERQNLFDRIADAHKEGTNFVVIIDEEHTNNTSKANDIINAFAAKNIIRVSATANKVSHQEYYEIPEDEVINAGLITRAIYVNEGVDEDKQIVNDYDYLLDLADEKRREIAENYKLVGANIRPLVLIQFPAGQPETIKAVEEKLESMGYTYDNGMVNIWMSDDKMVSDDLTALDGTPAFLLMKQAISTGWDCPRAKILVKLREGGSEEFQIQTIGRIRRMPERKHYGINVLDFCYLYTLDTKYKEGLLSSLDKAYQLRRLFLKDEVKGFSLTKELRNLDYDGLGERETLLKVHEYFKNTYSLTGNKENNKVNLAGAGYNFDEEIDSHILRGIFRTTEELTKQDAQRQIVMKTQVNTHAHGIYLLHAVDEIKKVTGMQSQKVKAILERMFRKGKNNKYKFLALDTNAFYIFADESLLEIDKPSISFSESSYETLRVELEDVLGERCGVIDIIKCVYDWAILADILADGEINGKSYLSVAKVNLYDKHKEDLIILKQLFKGNNKVYKEFFVDEGKSNYCAYVGFVNSNGSKKNIKRCNREDFIKNLKNQLGKIEKTVSNQSEYEFIEQEIQADTILPVQISKDNGVIPYAVYIAM